MKAVEFIKTFVCEECVESENIGICEKWVHYSAEELAQEFFGGVLISHPNYFSRDYDYYWVLLSEEQYNKYVGLVSVYDVVVKMPYNYYYIAFRLD